MLQSFPILIEYHEPQLEQNDTQVVKVGMLHRSFALLYYCQDWAQIEHATKEVEKVEVKVMMEYIDSEVEALNKVCGQMDMTRWVASRNVENEFVLSNLVAMVEKVSHADIDSHNTTIDQCQDKSMHVNYNQNSVERIQEPYLYLLEANFSLLPQHTSIQLQVDPLEYS